MTIQPLDGWTLARLLVGEPLNGERQAVSEPLRRIADHLAALPLEDRRKALNGYLCSIPDPAPFIKAVADADPLGLPPEGESTLERCATLADVRRHVADIQWPWPGWLASGVLNALAADPGTGKTIMAADLARRLWFGEKWPDNQTNALPAGTRTLWVPGDRHYVQLAELAKNHGLPDEAMLFNAPATDPTAGLDLDDPDELAALQRRIRSERPGLVIVDTVGMTTGRNLCRPEDARAYFGPLMEMAQQSGVPFLLLTHLSKDANALGRRIVGACRSVWKMTQPDPEGQTDRRRVWVDKTYIVKPPPLGMTIAAAGCSFDFSPPTAPEPEARRPGPSPAKLELCKAWLTDRLAMPDRVSIVRSEAEKAGHSPNTLYRAKDAMQIEEYDLDGRKWWKLPSKDEDIECPC